MRAVNRGALLSTLVAISVVSCWGTTQHRAPSGSSAESGAASGPGATRGPASVAPPAPGSVASPELESGAGKPLLLQERFSGVREALSLEDYRAALDRMTPLLGDLPSEREVCAGFFLLGRISESAQATDSAQKAYEEVIRRNCPLGDDAALRLSQRALGRGDTAESLAWLDRIRRLKDDPDLLHLRGVTLFRLGQVAEAETLFQASSEISREQALERAKLRVGHVLDHPKSDSLNAMAAAARLDLEHAWLGISPKHPMSQEILQLKRELEAGGYPVAEEEQVGLFVRKLSALLERSDAKGARVLLSEAGEPTLKDPIFVKDLALGCAFSLALGKLLALEKKWGESADLLQAPARKCESLPELHAKILFNAGKYAQADGRDTAAVRHFEELENRYPESHLADDARLRRARAEKEMGSRARYVDLLSTVAETYPAGDMSFEGALELALDQIERKEWATAELVLEQAVRAISARDAARGQEFSGAERYFLARAKGAQGKREDELREYERIVSELPLSYYMLHAHSRLREADPARAEAALHAGQRRAEQRPLVLPTGADLNAAELSRVLGFLEASEPLAARRAMEKTKSERPLQESFWFSVGLLFARSPEAAHTQLGMMGKVSEWLTNYPQGDWSAAWQAGYPRPHLPIVQREATASGVPEWMIYAIMREESVFDERAESPAMAYGLMQLIIPTAKMVAKPLGLEVTPGALKRPALNIQLGARALGRLFRHFGDNPLLAIPGYNAGPGRPDRWLAERPDVDFDVWVEMIPIRETRRYVKRVLASRATYAYLYYSEDREAAMALPSRLKVAP